MADLRAALDAALDENVPTDHIVTVEAAASLLDYLAAHPAMQGWVYEDPRLPDDLTGMSAQERGAWLSVERVYDASLRAVSIERNARTMTPFRDLVPEAQAAVVSTLLPVVQLLHGVALNPEARRG